MGEIYTRQRNGKWEYRFEKAPVNGKRKQASKGGFRTKKEALEAGTKALSEYNNSGQVFTPAEISFADYLDQWLDLYCKVNVKESTVEAYRKKIRLYIKPALGEYRLKAITASNIQTLINDKFNEGFSRNTLIVLKGILTGSLNYAVEPLQYIPYNPALMIKIPAKRAKPQTPTRKKDRRPVTNEEWQQIIERFPEGHPAHLPLVIAYRCGLRLGEVFGLMWDDIDFDAQTMRIDRQIQMNNIRKQWEFTAPKYDSSRTIDVDADTLSLLEREHAKQTRARAYYADLYTQQRADNSFLSDTTGDPVNLIMTREDGSYIQPRIMQHVGRIIHGVYNKNNPIISAEWDFHSLRHTHATALIEAGVPLSVVQKRLGHAKIEMTEHYTDHVTETMEESLREKLADMYKQKMSAPVGADIKINADTTRTNADRGQIL